jgi:hypothetical protein
VDTVYLGAWRREELLRLGGFDEDLVRNQDDELNLRITRSGGTVWQSALIRSSYAPRASFTALFRQFFQYGYWKVAVMRKHQLPASLRHVVPFIFVATVITGTMLAPLWPTGRIATLVVVSLYALAALFTAAHISNPLRVPREAVLVATAFACMHIGYGIGFSRGLWDFCIRRKGAREYATRLTR